MPETIDFSALIPDPWEITSRKGTKFLVDPDLDGNEAMWLMRNVENLSGTEAAEKCITIVLRAFNACQPITEEKLLSEFKLAEVIVMTMRFLARNGHGLSSSQAPPTNRTARRQKQRAGKR